MIYKDFFCCFKTTLTIWNPNYWQTCGSLIGKTRFWTGFWGCLSDFGELVNRHLLQSAGNLSFWCKYNLTQNCLNSDFYHFDSSLAADHQKTRRMYCFAAVGSAKVCRMPLFRTWFGVGKEQYPKSTCWSWFLGACPISWDKAMKSRILAWTCMVDSPVEKCAIHCGK